MSPTPTRARREGREQCTAHARSRGRRCQAPAIEGGWVCLKHGGAAPQVAIAARRRVLTERLFAAYGTWQQVHDPGRPAGQWMSRTEVNSLGTIAFLERELEQHDQDMQLIALMRAELADPHPETTATLLEIARARLAR